MLDESYASERSVTFLEKQICGDVVNREPCDSNHRNANTTTLSAIRALQRSRNESPLGRDARDICVALPG